jgi:ferrous iron transport protein A
MFGTKRQGEDRFMSEDRQVNLAQMRVGQSGTILRIEGGQGMTNRLNALGIIPGKRITKMSSMLMRGPVTAEVDRTRLAVGFGMASRILVRLENKVQE